MDAFQIRASLAAWIESKIELDATLAPADVVTIQADEGYNDNEWRLTWDQERKSKTDQNFSRLVQIDRHRSDGDENAFEQELAKVLSNMGLDRAGKAVLVPVYESYTDPTLQIGTARVKRLNDEGWVPQPDPGMRPKFIRAVLTLSTEYIGN